ncbi:carbohydrate kinase [Synechococcus sp. CCAP 1479/9]|uniref:carbohydrate kinase family protein n=1 Tax=Synechococcus sp. CCAP 1479/9 TaxID=1221593 RepID=UPI001C23A69E|nr:carbohydrate kinase [Synechococcus sp. CCAP 1479/9]
MPTRCPITIFGEVLFDCFPDATEVLGGAPFNVAWHLRGFGLSPRLVSRVGGDARGERIRSAMGRWGLDASALQTDPCHPTGRVSVTLVDGEPRYAILSGSAYDFIDPPEPAMVPAAGLLYHGTLALRHQPSASALTSLKSRHRGPIVLDVNLRRPWWSIETVLPLVDAADHVKLNAAELALLTPDGPPEDDRDALAASMHRFAERHRLETLVVTRGALGALHWRGGVIVSVAAAAAGPVVDTVGAGDGFAAVLLLGLSQGWPWAETVARAGDFAAALVSQRGATIDDPSLYAQFLASWGVG